MKTRWEKSEKIPKFSINHERFSRTIEKNDAHALIGWYLKSHLTYGASIRPENAVTYSAGNEGQKTCGDLPETTAFKSYAAKHERKSQYANFQTYPRSAFSA